MPTLLSNTHDDRGEELLGGQRQTIVVGLCFCFLGGIVIVFVTKELATCYENVLRSCYRG
jgi:hypothetical protein